MESEYAASLNRSQPLTRLIEVPKELSSEVIALDASTIYPELGQEGVAAEDAYVLMNTDTEVEELVAEEVEEIPSIEEPSEVVVAEPLEALEEPVEGDRRSR